MNAFDPSLSVPPADPDPVPPVMSLPQLTAKQQAAFRDAAQAAYNIARTYNGSGLKRDVFRDKMRAITDFVEPFSTGTLFTTEDVLASCARQARTIFADRFSLQKFYDTAF